MSARKTPEQRNARILGLLDDVAALRSQNAELRAALREILDSEMSIGSSEPPIYPVKPPEFSWIAWATLRRAEAALAEGEGAQKEQSNGKAPRTSRA